MAAFLDGPLLQIWGVNSPISSSFSIFTIYNKANKRAKKAKKLLKKAESEAKDVKQFQIQMARSKLDAQVAIEAMYDADREAQQARLESAAALATIDAIKTVRNSP